MRTMRTPIVYLECADCGCKISRVDGSCENYCQDEEDMEANLALFAEGEEG